MSPADCSEDYALGSSLSPVAAAELYRNIASGAESGMDFTVRWFSEPGANMSTIRTTQIIPVELNAYLYDMERNMAAFANELGDASAAANFTNAAAARAAAITSLMWNSSSGKGWPVIRTHTISWLQCCLECPIHLGISTCCPCFRQAWSCWMWPIMDRHAAKYKVQSLASCLMSSMISNSC